MKKSEFLETLEFNTFERYPPQMSSIYLKCDGIHKYSKRYKCQFIRINQFNAVTFNPQDVIKTLKNKSVNWNFSWLPAIKVDMKYDKGNFIECNFKHK